MGFDFVATTLVILSYFNCVSCAHYWWNILLIEVHCYSDFNIILSLACAEMVVFLRSVSNLLSPCFSAASTSRKMIEIVATWKHFGRLFAISCRNSDWSASGKILTPLSITMNWKTTMSQRDGYNAVSYTHLTLPTIYSV